MSFDSKVPILFKNKFILNLTSRMFLFAPLCHYALSPLKSWCDAHVEHVSAVVTLYESAFSIARRETRQDAVFDVVYGLP